ncbi:hypothetical protein HEK616_52170 [Streptomyces nigrescens]|uniref:Uncharacterized protein n=1 Tax=Streptomyces nigrescens TaxID=1920 RepID=A0ABM7ZZC1_STRNI|nr:hypothetical protein [Streptomyces nigrescens]BDM71730.1 hypothetical protein HEK616_52170 [Streptomyces nigrescens]
MDEETETGTKKKEKRIDLSVAQVSGSALAAAVAAYLAGQLGVYGTIIGAGLVSVVATTGGSIFQHLFRRTGEQIKEASVSTRPRPRRSSSRTRSTTRQTGRPDPTMVLPTFDKQGTEDHVTSVAAKTSGPDTARTQVIPRAVQALRRDPANAHPIDRTQMVPRLDVPTMTPVQAPARPDAVLPPAGSRVGRPEEVSATTYGTRLRGWKRPALGALAVFALAMGGVTATELLTGQTPSGQQGTTLGNLTRTGSAGRHQPVTPQSPGPGGTPGDGGRHGNGGATPDPGRSGDTGNGRGTDHGTPSPSPSPSDGGKTSPDPEGSPSTNPSTNPSPSGSADSGGTGSGDATGGHQGGQQSGPEPEAEAPEPGAS